MMAYFGSWMMGSAHRLGWGPGCVRFRAVGCQRHVASGFTLTEVLKIMSSIQRGLCVLFLAAVSVGVSAQTLDVSLCDNSALFDYSVSTASHGGFGNTAADLGIYFTNTDDTMAMLGLQVVDGTGTGSPGLEAGVGAKLFALRADAKQNIVALTLGGQLHYSPESASRVGLMVQGFFAPDIVTFGDGKQFLFATARVGYLVMQQAEVYFGFRRVQTTISSRAKVGIESGPHIGLQVMF